MHKTATREEWLAARLELLKAEKELTRQSDEIARRRQELPWVKIDKEYRFETDDGSFAGAHFTAGGCELRISLGNHAAVAANRNQGTK
jgi:predicted dithiol-disulfide oxidoreductase (DUF899 family)